MDNWLEALSVFLEEFSADEIRQGFILYREKAVTHVSRGGNQYLVNVSVDRAYTIHIYLDNGRCTAYIMPPSESETHRHMLYAGALELHKLLMSNRAIPENRRVASRLRKQDEDLQNWLALVRQAQPQCRLTTDQQNYLTAVWELYSRLTPQDHLHPRQLRQIEKNFQPRNLKPFDFWVTKPDTIQEFWQFVAYGLELHDHPVPDFLVDLTDSAAVRQKVESHTRHLNIQRWREYMDDAQSQMLVAETRGTEVRLVIGRKRCRWQIREPGRADFVEMRREDFLDWHAREEEGELALSASGLVLWPHLACHWQRTQELHMNLTRVATAFLLNRIFLDKNTRPYLVDESGDPLIWEEIPLSWQCRDLAPGEDQYSLVMIDKHGNPAPPGTIHLPGLQSLYLWENRICEGPRPLGFQARYPCSGQLPQEVVESTQGLTFLDALGAQLPESLIPQIEPREFEIHIRVYLANHTRIRGDSVECALFEITAVEPVSCRKERLGPGGWETLVRGSLPEDSPAKGSRALLLFQQKHKQESLRLLQQLGARPRGTAAGWMRRMEDGFEDSLVQWIDKLPDFVHVQMEGELATLQDAPVTAGLLLNVKPHGIDWLDVEITLQTAETTLTQEQLQQLLEARGKFTRIPGQGWKRLELNLNAEQSAQLEAAGIQPWSTGKRQERLHVLSVAQPGFEMLFHENDWRTILERKQEFHQRQPMDLPAGLHAQLRGYQKEGFDFLCYLTKNEIGGILADDMGLGKTIQTLAWFLWLKETGKAQPFTALVLCPKSVMHSWQGEIRNFSPSLSSRLYEPGLLKRLPVDALPDLLIVNYTQLRLNADDFREHVWTAAVLDEGQYIKSPKSATARAAFSLKAQNRLVLTGTPIENRLMDIWSLMNFAMPGVLGSRTSFANSYDQNPSPQAAQFVRKRLIPFMLRRTKAEAAQDLPERLVEVLHIRLEGKQEALYQAELQEARRALLKISTTAEFQKNRFSILRSLTRLRQICCDPGLLMPQKRRLPSAKLDRMLEMIQEACEEGHKVLVFSQFVSMLEIIRDKLEERGSRYLFLTGRSENRGVLVDSFQEATEPLVFLLSLRAAGAGINLNTASYVFLYDPWWNPAVEEQAINRAHRIGTRKNVIIYRLVAENTIEEKMQTLKFAKSSLANNVIDDYSNGIPESLSLSDLRQLLEADFTDDE